MYLDPDGKSNLITFAPQYLSTHGRPERRVRGVRVEGEEVGGLYVREREGIGQRKRDGERS